MDGYSTFSNSPRLEPRHQIIQCHTRTLAERRDLPYYRDAVGVFYLIDSCFLSWEIANKLDDKFTGFYHIPLNGIDPMWVKPALWGVSCGLIDILRLKSPVWHNSLLARSSNAFPKDFSEKVRGNQPRLGFELAPQCPFPTMITTTSITIIVLLERLIVQESNWLLWFLCLMAHQHSWVI